MAAERELEAAAHRDAVHRGHHRLGAGFQRQDHAQQVRLGDRLRRAELADVRAAGERLAGAGDDDGLDGIVGQRLGQAVGDAEARVVAEAVDRRVVQRDHRDIAADFVGGTHAGTSCGGRGKK